MITISRSVALADDEIVLSGIRAQGAGGQHVNKASTAIHLRFDIKASSLPEFYKERLLAASHHLISADGVVIIKAQEYRSQEMNRAAALQRLLDMVRDVAVPPKARRATRPSFGAKQRRLEGKSQRAQVKAARAKVGTE